MSSQRTHDTELNQPPLLLDLNRPLCLFPYGNMMQLHLHQDGQSALNNTRPKWLPLLIDRVKLFSLWWRPNTTTSHYQLALTVSYRGSWEMRRGKKKKKGILECHSRVTSSKVCVNDSQTGARDYCRAVGKWKSERRLWIKVEHRVWAGGMRTRRGMKMKQAASFAAPSDVHLR